MQVQRLSRDEWQRFKAIRLRALGESPDAFGSTFAETSTRPDANWIEQVATIPTFLAVVGSRDVGVVRASLDEDEPGALGLISMWVAPEARGQAVGDALIDALIAWAKEQGFKQVLLDVADENRHAVALYERKGFRPTGKVGSLPPPRDHVREHQRALVL